MTIDIAGYSLLGDRPVNEDSVCYQKIDSQSAFMAVCDGLGGQGDGQIASSIAIRQFCETMQLHKLPNTQRIEQWMTSADCKIRAKQTLSSKMMTTAAYLCVCQGQAIWAHIGDTRIYYYFNGKPRCYSVDHSVSQMRVYMNEITRDEIRKDKNRSKLTRALGDGTASADIHCPVVLKKGVHAFLICSDGVWEAVSDDQILACLNRSKTAEEWIKNIQTFSAPDAGEKDNQSAVAMIVRI